MPATLETGPIRLYPGDTTPSGPYFDDDWFRFYGPRDSPLHYEVHELCNHYKCSYRDEPCPWHPADCRCSIPPCTDPMLKPDKEEA
jgi:hypothetical protein